MAPIRYELRQSTDKDKEHCRFTLHSTRAGSGEKFFYVGTLNFSFPEAVNFAHELAAVLVCRDQHAEEFERIYSAIWNASVNDHTLDDECLDRK